MFFLGARLSVIAFIRSSVCDVCVCVLCSTNPLLDLVLLGRDLTREPVEGIVKCFTCKLRGTRVMELVCGGGDTDEYCRALAPGCYLRCAMNHGGGRCEGVLLTDSLRDRA